MVVQSRGPLWAIEPTGQQSLPQQQQQQQQEPQEQQDQQLQQSKHQQQTQMQPETLQEHLEPNQHNSKSQPELLQQQAQTAPNIFQQQTHSKTELLQEQPVLQQHGNSEPPKLEQQTKTEQSELLQQHTHTEPEIIELETHAHQELLEQKQTQPEPRQQEAHIQPDQVLPKPQHAQTQEEHTSTNSKLLLQHTATPKVLAQSELSQTKPHLVKLLTESSHFEKNPPEQTQLRQPEPEQVLAKKPQSSASNEEPKTANTNQAQDQCQLLSTSVQSQQLQPSLISLPHALSHPTKPSSEQTHEQNQTYTTDSAQLQSQQVSPQQVLSKQTQLVQTQTQPQLLQSKQIQTLQTVPKPTVKQLVLSQPTLLPSTSSVQPMTVQVQHQNSQQQQTKQVQLQQISPQQVQTLEPKRQQVHTQQVQLHLTQVPAPQLSQLQVPQPKLSHLLVPQPQSNQPNQQPLLLQTQQHKVSTQQHILLKQKQLKQSFAPAQTQQSLNNNAKQPVLQQLKPSLTLQLQTQQLSQKQQQKTVLSLQRQNTQWKQHFKIVSDEQLVKDCALNSNYQELQKKVEVKKSFNFAVPAKKPPPRHSGMVEWKNTFNMRPVMLTTLRERRSQRGGSSGNLMPLGRVSPSGYVPVGAARSLDLLRTNLQNAINRDIQQVLNKYMERFFNPAMDNIRTNLGQESVVEDHVRVLCLRVLEEAKLMYNSTKKRKRHDKFRPSRPHENRLQENHSKTDASPPKLLKRSKSPQPITLQNGVSVSNSGTNMLTPPGNLQQMFRKRKEMESEAEATRRKHARLMSSNISGVDGQGNGSAVNSVPSGTLNEALNGVSNGTVSGAMNRAVNKTVNKVVNGVTSSSSKLVSISPIVVTASTASTGTRVTPVLSVPTVSSNTTPARTIPQVSMNYQTAKWDPDRITSDTLFVMGARANKVLGYGQTRGRLYSKHQELFKYPGDQEDKEWLTKNNFMTPNGGKAFLMIMQDIHELANSADYRNNPNVMLHELKGFRAPDFMVRKIRSFMRNHRAEPLDDLSGLLDMELLPGLCGKEGGSLPLETSSSSTRSLLDAGVTDDSLIELALEYGVTLLGESESSSSTPQLTTSLTTLPPSLEALAPRTQATSRSVKSVSVSTSTSTPTSPQSRLPGVKGLNRSLSLPSSIAGHTLSGSANFNSEQLIEIPLTPTPTIEELELLIKTESVGTVARGARRPHNAILDSIDPQEDVFDHIMRAETKGDLDADLDASLDATLDAANLDENLDANLDASLDANLDLNLDVNLDMNLDSDGIGYLGLILEEDSSNQELNTPSHSPQAQDYTSMSQTDTLNSSGENSLAMSHATLSALLAGSTLDGLEIPEGLL